MSIITDEMVEKIVTQTMVTAKKLFAGYSHRDIIAIAARVAEPLILAEVKRRMEAWGADVNAALVEKYGPEDIEIIIRAAQDAAPECPLFKEIAG